MVDGDTVDAIIDVGFRLTTTQRLRLLGVNTPELHDKDLDVRARAVEAKEFTAKWIDARQGAGAGEWPLIVRTEKSDVFGRWLAEVGVLDGTQNGLNAELLRSGHAVVFKA